MRNKIIILAMGLLLACTKKNLPEGNIQGLAKFQLSGGTAISQPGVDDYNPQVLQQGDNFLVLVFASNRSCGTCTGHNLFIARSTTAYNNDAVFPAFENPTVITVTGTPLNYATPIAFAPALTGNNVRIFLTNAGGTVQQTAAITPGGATDTTLTTIANTAGQTSTVVGVEFTGDKLYTRQNGTMYSFNHASAADPLVAMATGQNATSVASIDGSFTSRYDAFFSLIDGTITSMSLYGNGGNLVSVNTAIAKARLSARYVSVMRGGGFKGGLMFISGVESGGSTQDMYVVDGMTVYQMWQLINPKPPGAPDGTSTGGGTTTTADPAYSPVAGHYAMPLNVTITSTTSGAIVCYTTDGVTDPTCDATPACTTGSTYAGAISFYNLTRTFRARACKAGLADSPVISATHVSDGMQPTTPTAPAANATSSSQVQLTWTASTDAGTTTPQIVYEICQTTINNGCNTFTTSFTSSAGATSYDSTGLSASTTYYYRIRSRDLAGNTSGYTAQLSATTAAGPSVSAPTFSVTPGTFNSAQNVTVSTSTGSAILCYSTDGSTPACDATPSCTTGNLYSSAVNIASTATLRAIGCRSGYTNSSVTVGTYTIDTVAPVISATAPASSTSPANTQVSYTLSESCASGSITWTRTGGTADASSPRIQALAGTELNIGAHNNITLTNNPALVNGTVYDITFNCTDAAGNAAATITNTTVTFNPITPGTAIWVSSITAGTGGVYFMGTAVDSAGNIYAAGYQNGTGSYTYAPGITATGPSASGNAVLVKYNSSGVAQWAKVPTAGAQESRFKALAIDSSGNIFASGYQSGTSSHTYAPGITVSGASNNNNSLLVRYDSSGTAQWAKTTSTGSFDSEFDAVAVDNGGNVYAAGQQTTNGVYTYGPGITATGSAGCCTNVTLVKYDASGNAQWAKTTTAGGQNAGFNALTINSTGDIYAAGFQTGNSGYTFAPGVSATGAYSGGSNSVIVKYDSSGTAQWAKSITATSQASKFYALCLDTTGNIFAGGFQNGAVSYTYGPGVSATGTGVTANATLVKYNAAGTAQWAKSITAGGGPTEFSGLTSDSSGNIFAAGNQGSGSHTYVSGVSVTGSSTGANVVLVKYDSSGTAQYARSVNTGTGASAFQGATMDTSGNLYLAGYQTGTTTFTYGAGVSTAGSSTSQNPVITKYSP